MSKVSTIVFKISLVCALIATSCDKTDTPNQPTTPTHPFGEGFGKHSFWSGGTNFYYPIVITVTDKNGKNVKVIGYNGDSITSKPLSPITCDNLTSLQGPAFAASIIDTAGDYHFDAVSKDGFKWSGTFTIYPDVCHPEELNGSYQMGNGLWKKIDNGNQGNSAGVIVQWNGVTGTVTSNPNNSCLQVGTVVWKNLNASGGSMEYLGCSGGFIQGKLTDVNTGHFYLDGIEYDKQ